MRRVNTLFLVGMFLGAVFFGALDWAIFDSFSNHRNRDESETDIVIQSFIELVGLAFSIFTGWILYQVEQEQKDVAEAVAKRDLDNPLSGAVSVRIPRSWRQRLHDHHPNGDDDRFLEKTEEAPPCASSVCHRRWLRADIDLIW